MYEYICIYNNQLLYNIYAFMPVSSYKFMYCK